MYKTIIDQCEIFGNTIEEVEQKVREVIGNPTMFRVIRLSDNFVVSYGFTTPLN